MGNSDEKSSGRTDEESDDHSQSVEHNPLSDTALSGTLPTESNTVRTITNSAPIAVADGGESTGADSDHDNNPDVQGGTVQPEQEGDDPQEAALDTAPAPELPFSAPDADERTGYDYQGGPITRPDFVAELRERIDGEVRFDEYSRQLYATDASSYEVTPVGVVFPTSTQDVATVVDHCNQADIPVLPRGGGTSLAGQAVNEAVILDFTQNMADIRAIDSNDRTVRAQPGIVLGDLNAKLSEHGLKFAPDPAWGDKSALGGAIGNNSTGSHSLVYGKTDVYVESCEVVLADGTITELGEMTVRELRQKAQARSGKSELEGDIYQAVRDLLDDAETIEDAYPTVHRNVSGYNLDQLIAEAEDGTVNLARLLAGSEGTLAIITEATVSLEPVPTTKGVALLRYETLSDAMADVQPILEHEPAAVEVLDDVLLDLARETEEFGSLVAEMVPAETGAVLLVEFYAEDEKEARQLVADLLADRIPTAIAQAVPSEDAQDITTDPQRAIGADEAQDKAERDCFWKLRKSGLPILLSRTSDAKHGSFVEDVAVAPGNLPEFVADFQAILEEHDTFASFYGHAGPGCLHVRPLINTKTQDGLESMESIAEAVSDLAIKYNGSISGEHGDGRARTQWNRKQYGQDVWELFRELKTAFDPNWLLNPGQVCGYAPEEMDLDVPDRARAVQLTENLRFSPEYSAEPEFDPQLIWQNENGMQGMIELCHGCGGCRGHQETTGGVMCPTYRASREEITSTRGRANALRQAISGDLPEHPASEEFMTEVLDLCIGCKGCARDCPSEVDMAKLKAEVQYQHHQQGQTTIRDRLFGNIDRVSAIGSTLAPLSQYIQAIPGSDRIAESVFGIAREREFPTFKRESFVDWWSERGPKVSQTESTGSVVLFPDTYTNYHRPDIGKHSVELLETLGVHVTVLTDGAPSGRAAFSQGFLDKARTRAHMNVDALLSYVEDGWDIVVIEPSDAVMFQSDYLDLLSGEDVQRIATATYGLCEYIDRDEFPLDLVFDGEGSVTYHGHCHQKATNRDHHSVSVLREAGYDVDAVDSGCCGMAGSFGYEAEHYSMSEAIGTILMRQLSGSSGERIVAPGASCRTQISDLTDDSTITTGINDTKPAHPVELLCDALEGDKPAR